ncbi:MAG TPA: HEAT repeat domain-containing protein [Nevskia sp.]|nr:HEAT repeat domain-containing protein [Nevskia sp.]
MNQPIQAPTLPPGAAALAEAPAAPAASALPELSRFREAVERRFRAESPDTFWSLEEAFRQLVVDGTFAAVFNRELRRLLDDPCYMGNWRANQIVLNRGRGHVLSIWLFDQPRRYIHSTPYYGMFAPLGAESLYYDVYRLPENYRNAQFDPEVRLEPAGSGFTAPGGVLLLDSDRYVYDFKVERPLAVAKFSSAAYQTLEWLFERDTLRAWQANDSELVSTQLRVAAYILGRLADASSLEALDSLSDHRNHSVRWAAVQTIARLDREAALQRLRQALDDPHPHLRRAAAGSLRRLQTNTRTTG